MALEIKTNFEENLKEMILRGLDINLENPLFEDLNNKDARELMIIDSNFRKRLPVPISREVIISNELISSAEYTRFEPIINIIKKQRVQTHIYSSKDKKELASYGITKGIILK